MPTYGESQIFLLSGNCLVIQLTGLSKNTITLKWEDDSCSSVEISGLDIGWGQVHFSFTCVLHIGYLKNFQVTAEQEQDIYSSSNKLGTDICYNIDITFIMYALSVSLNW